MRHFWEFSVITYERAYSLRHTYDKNWKSAELNQADTLGENVVLMHESDFRRCAFWEVLRNHLWGQIRHFLEFPVITYEGH